MQSRGENDDLVNRTDTMRPERGGDASMNLTLYARAARVLASCGFSYMDAMPVAGPPGAGRCGDNLFVTGFNDTCPVHPGVVLYMAAEDTGSPGTARECTDARRMGWSYGVSGVYLVYPSRALVVHTGNVPGDAGDGEGPGVAGCGWKDILMEEPPSDRSSLGPHGVPEPLRALVQQHARDRGSEEAPVKKLAERLILAEKVFRRALLAENPGETDIRLSVASMCMTLALLMRTASSPGVERTGVETGPSWYIGKLLEETDPWYCDISTLRLPERTFEEAAAALDPGGTFVLHPLPHFTVFRALNWFCMGLRGGPGYHLIPADAGNIHRSVLDVPVAGDYVREIAWHLTSDRRSRFLEIAEGPGTLAPLIAWCLVAQDRLAATHGFSGSGLPGPLKPVSSATPETVTRSSLGRIFLASPDLCTVLACRAFLLTLEMVYGDCLVRGYESGAGSAGTMRLCSPFVTRSWWDRHWASFPGKFHETPPPSISELFVQPETAEGFSSVLVTSGSGRSHIKGRDRAFLEENSAVYQKGAGVFQYLAEQALEKTAPGGHLFSLSPAGWLFSAQGRQIRALFSRFNVMRLDSFESGHAPGVQGDTVGMVLQKGPPGTYTRHSRFRYRRDSWVRVYDGVSAHPGHEAAYWSFEDRSVSLLRRRLEEAGTPLGEYCMGEVIVCTTPGMTGNGLPPCTTHDDEACTPGREATAAPDIRFAPGHHSPDPFTLADIHGPHGSHARDLLMTVRIPGRDRYLISFLESSLASFYISTHPLLRRDLPGVIASLPVRVPDLFDPSEKALYDAVLASRKRVPPAPGGPETEEHGGEHGNRQLPCGPDDLFFRLYGLTPEEAAVIRGHSQVTVSARDTVPVFKKKRRRRRRKAGGQ
jgi:hypothetical protein